MLHLLVIHTTDSFVGYSHIHSQVSKLVNLSPFEGEFLQVRSLPWDWFIMVRLAFFDLMLFVKDVRFLESYIKNICPII